MKEILFASQKKQPALYVTHIATGENDTPMYLYPDYRDGEYYAYDSIVGETMIFSPIPYNIRMLRVNTTFIVTEMVNVERDASDFEIIDRTTDAYISFTCQYPQHRGST